MTLHLFDLIRRMSIRVTTPQTVFEAGGLPSVTYVKRDHLRIEARLAEALARRHAFTIVSGPTKCGKSVACQRVLGRSRYVVVQGGQAGDAEGFWRNLSHALGLPTSTTRTRMRSRSLRGLFEVGAGVPGMLSKKASVDHTSGRQDASSSTYAPSPMLAALDRMRSRDTVLIVEDFHYLDHGTQRSVVRALKSAVFDGLRVVLLAVPHRAFDPADVESEVEGRVNYVAIPRWSTDDLIAIADQGFSALRMTVPRRVLARMSEDAFGNPLLMQEICYAFALERLSGGSSPRMPEAELSLAYDRVVASKGLDRYERFAQCVVPDGPSVVTLREGGEEAVAMVLLSAVARSGPKPLSGYAEIRESFVALSRDAPPSPERLGALCAAMASTVSSGHGAPLEWLQATHELALTDPFLMFYMRWLLRDKRSLVLKGSALSSAIGVMPGAEPAAQKDGE